MLSLVTRVPFPPTTTSINFFHKYLVIFVQVGDNRGVLGSFVLEQKFGRLEGLITQSALKICRLKENELCAVYLLHTILR